MGAIHHVSAKQKNEAVKEADLKDKGLKAHIQEDMSFQVPQWQIDMVRESVKYHKEHPEELISEEDFWKMVDVD